MNKKITLYELEGLIKDNKAPYKINYQGDIYIFAGDDYSKNDDQETWLITNYDYFLSTFLNETVEILGNEETDEFEDIEEIIMPPEDLQFSKRQNGMTKEDRTILDVNFINIGIILNQLIRNQKYLKNELDKIKEGNYE